MGIILWEIEYPAVYIICHTDIADWLGDAERSKLEHK